MTVWSFRKKMGTKRRGGLLKNSLLQDILWSFSGWLTENLISSWACNCRSFCSMSAIADLINKVLWQCTVYFQGLDLRAGAQGWDTVYPTYTRAGTLTQYTVQHVCAQTRTHACGTRGQRMIRLVLFCIFLIVNKSHENIRANKFLFLSLHTFPSLPVDLSHESICFYWRHIFHKYT